MTWLSEQNGCGKCDKCGMDMDLQPFCVDSSVLSEKSKQTGRNYPYGLDVNPARIICQGDQFTPRQPRI
ncbi:hypothetical protein D3C77_702440 [compost metagenome]